MCLCSSAWSPRPRELEEMFPEQALPCSTNLLRGYSANQCICDESAFFRDDETMFYSVLFPMLQTTQSTLIASSTPWTKNSVFYKFTQDPAFEVHRTTIDDVVKEGLTTTEFVEEMRRRIPPTGFVESSKLSSLRKKIVTSDGPD